MWKKHTGDGECIVSVFYNKDPQTFKKYHCVDTLREDVTVQNGGEAG